MSWTVLYTDDFLHVLEKPSGMLAVPGRGPDKQDCLSAHVQAMDAQALVVHRLDMGTSGLMVMARNQATQRLLSLAFAQRTLYKRYTAVVHGIVQAPTPTNGSTYGSTNHAPDAWGVIDLPIALDWAQRPKRVIDASHGKPSQTRWKIDRWHAAEQTTRLTLEPTTGRSHQLRVHLQALGHPILGDAWYAPANVAAMAPRLLLHACTLGFAHPAHGRWVQFESTPGF